MDIKEAKSMNAKFILVGCETVKERDGMSEFWHVLVKFCKKTPLEVFELPVKGLFLIAIDDDLEEIMSKIKDVISGNKFEFIACRKFTPLNRMLDSNLESLKEILPKMLKKIPETAKWRIAINRRHTGIKRNEIINAIASHPSAPKGKVDLKNPDWIIQIEVLGEWLGIGVFSDNLIVSLDEK
ncbi:MAG: hypothetical protein HZR80_19805 [Candidatus Heimdallarchaeota archaeon]